MYEYSATVVHIRDGDSLRLDCDLGFGVHLAVLDVRLKGIDCPELGRSDGLGEQAREYVVVWLRDHPGPYVVRTFKDRTEKFGRMLAVVIAQDGAQLGDDLVRAGLARLYDGHGPRPWPPAE